MITDKMKKLLRAIDKHDLGGHGAQMRELVYHTDNLKPPYDTLKRMCRRGMVLRMENKKDFYHDGVVTYILTATGKEELENAGRGVPKSKRRHQNKNGKAHPPRS